MRWPWSPPVPLRTDQIGTPGPYPWWRRHWLALTSAMVVVVVVAAAAVVWAVAPWRHCGPGLESVGSVCVGLDLDSSGFTGNDPLRGLETTIARDNAKAGPDFATIVYLDDMEPNPADDSVGPSVLKHRVEGVITAERNVNDTTLAGPEAPKIKVLLANYGNGADNEKAAVNAILQANRNGQHIAAVTGFGQSLQNTRKAIESLSENGITTVGSVISGDDMNQNADGQPIDNFFRVTSTNQDEARAAVSYMAGKHYTSVTLVQDRNPGDDYANNLATDFSAELRREYPGLKLDTEPYQSPDGQLTGSTRAQYMENQFANMHSDLCDDKPDLVYFAGRGADLEPFLAALAQSGACGLGRVDVLSGDDVNTQVGTPLPTSDNVSFRVFYTAVATTNEWTYVPGDVTDREDYDQFVNGFTRRDRFPAGDVSDGHAIMEYDALLTAATAIRRDKSAAGNPSSLVSAFYRFDCRHPVPGASGQIAFYRKGGSVAGQGNPIDKAVPIMQVAPDGQAKQQAMAWSDGKPFSDPAECGQLPDRRVQAEPPQSRYVGIQLAGTEAA